MLWAPSRALQPILCPVDFSDASVRSLEYAEHRTKAARNSPSSMSSKCRPTAGAYPASGDFNVTDPPGRGAECLRLRAMTPNPFESSSYQDRRPLRRRYDHSCGWRRAQTTVVMGVHGRGAVERLFRVETARVIRAATCPFLVVRRP